MLRKGTIVETTLTALTCPTLLGDLDNLLGKLETRWHQREEVIPKQRGRRRSRPVTVEQILAWADAHHARTGTWNRCCPRDDNPGYFKA